MSAKIDKDKYELVVELVQKDLLTIPQAMSILENVLELDDVRIKLATETIETSLP